MNILDAGRQHCRPAFAENLALLKVYHVILLAFSCGRILLQVDTKKIDF